MGIQAITVDTGTSIYRGGHYSSGGLSYFTQGESGGSRIQILTLRLQALHVFHQPLLAANKHQDEASPEANWSSDGAYSSCFSSLEMLSSSYLMAPYLLLCKGSGPGPKLLTAGWQLPCSLILSPSKSALGKGAQMESLMFCLLSLS